MNSTQPKAGKKPWRAALEDALVVGGLVLFSTLAVQGPPDLSGLYTAGIASGLAALMAYARARKISAPPQ